jgi:hypothetical protein
MNVKKMYNEMIVTSLLLNFFDALLSAGAVFSVGYFIVYFYRMPILIAIIATVIFFIISIIKKIRENKILLLEKKNPGLKERLRTSYEYKDQANTVINDLHKDILNMMKTVDVNSFLNNRRLFLKISVICIMLTATLYMSSIGFDASDITRAISKTAIFKGGSEFIGDMLGQTRDQAKNRTLLDKPELIDSGNKELNISIDTYNTELDINDISNPEKNDFGGNYPDEIAGAADKVYEENIPEEYKDAVKEYFEKING